MIHLEFHPEIEAQLTAEAHARSLSLEKHVEQIVTGEHAEHAERNFAEAPKACVAAADIASDYPHPSQVFTDPCAKQRRLYSPAAPLHTPLIASRDQTHYANPLRRGLQ